MKNINYKKVLTGSLMALLVLSTPIASFAKENENNGRGNEKQEQKQVQERERIQERSWFGSSWFNGKSSKNITTTPVITNLVVTSNKARKATIKWNTDVRSNSMVWYSTTSPVNTTTAPTMKRNDRVLKHKIELNKLTPNTIYYVVVGGATNGEIGKSTETSFTTGTTQANISVPVITSVTGTATMKVGETASFTINAYDPQSKTLTSEVNWGDGYTTAPSTFSQTATLTHVYNTIGTYVVKFTVTNSDGKKATYPMQIKVKSLDTTAPVISGTVVNVTASNATITWTTNEPGTSSVYYGTNTPVDTNATATLKVTDGSFVTNHSLMIPNLTSSTLYHFILKSTDASNNVVLSSDSTFTTTN